MDARKLALALALLVPALFAGCAARLSPQGLPQPGLYRRVMERQDLAYHRRYLLHLPPGYEQGTPLPLVVVLHGAFSSARLIEQETVFGPLADRDRFLVLYPNGLGLFGLFRHWNAGFCCGHSRKKNVDDLGFVAAAIEEVCRRFPVDRSRVYLVGNSNGGMLAYRFAAERPEAVAALAVVSATIGGRPAKGAPEWRVPRPRQPVPLLAIHGRDDDTVPFERSGGPSEASSSSPFLSVPESLLFWAEANDCAGEPERDEPFGGRIERSRWSGEDQQSEVLLCAISDWGHVWPGSKALGRLPAGDPLREFDAAEAIWEFLRGRRREGATGAAGFRQPAYRPARHRGVDLALELAGLRRTLEQALRSLAPGGRLAVAGLGDEEVPIHPQRDLLCREAEIIGVADHLAQEIPELIGLVREGKLDLGGAISRTIPLDPRPINEALDRLDGFGGELRVVIVS